VWTVKKWIPFIVLLIAAPAAQAEVFIRVCLADGNTPLELADPCIPFVYRPLMTGTHLTIIVSSNTGGDYWGGGLYIEDPYMDYGTLFGRDYNEITSDWEGSHLEAAGPGATVWYYPESFKSGFELATDTEATMPGDWFVIDYNATNVGDCNVWLYDYDFSFDEPNYVMAFTHVPTRDFDNDGIVNFSDFAVLGLNWQRTDCNEPGNCSGTDLDADGYVGINDLRLFAEYWLEKTR
jgi:hypothetical protein